MIKAALSRMLPLGLSWGSEWKERLGGVAQTLTQLNASSEKEFLLLSQRLQKFYQGAKEISELSTSVSARIDGEETAAVISELRNVTERVKGLDAESEQGLSALNSVLNGFEIVREHIVVFEKVVMNLQMLCNSLRIESARIQTGDSGLSTLVDDVKRLTANIRMQSDHLRNRAEEMGRQIRESLAAISRYKKLQHGHARLILEDTGKSLTSLMERHSRSSESLQGLASRWDVVSRSVGEIVSSIQFQDITRQRIEHVIETLEEIRGKLNSRRVSKKSRSEEVQEAVTGCELQRAQLHHAQEEMTRALKRIMASLRDLSDQTASMSEETEVMAGLDGGGPSYFEELKSRLSTLVRVMAEYGELRGKLGRATGDVSETIGQMTALVKEIDKIGIDMKMVALNACIHAAHIGEAGLGLGVLAEALHHLASSTAEQIEKIAANLKSLISTASGLSLPDHTETPDMDKNMAQHLEKVMEPIHRLQLDTSGLLSRMQKSGENFSEEIERTIRSIEAHGGVKEVVEEVNGEIQSIVAEMREVLPAENRVESAGDLSEAAERYTMHSEREIHKAVLLGDGPGNVKAEKDGVSGFLDGEPKEDLGDNVELF